MKKVWIHLLSAVLSLVACTPPTSVPGSPAASPTPVSPLICWSSSTPNPSSSLSTPTSTSNTDQTHILFLLDNSESIRPSTTDSLQEHNEKLHLIRLRNRLAGFLATVAHVIDSIDPSEHDRFILSFYLFSSSKTNPLFEIYREIPAKDFKETEFNYLLEQQANTSQVDYYWEALKQGYEKLEKTQVSRKVLIFIVDDRPDRNKTMTLEEFEKIEELLRSSYKKHIETYMFILTTYGESDQPYKRWSHFSGGFNSQNIGPIALDTRLKRLEGNTLEENTEEQERLTSMITALFENAQNNFVLSNDKRIAPQKHLEVSIPPDQPPKVYIISLGEGQISASDSEKKSLVVSPGLGFSSLHQVAPESDIHLEGTSPFVVYLQPQPSDWEVTVSLKESVRYGEKPILEVQIRSKKTKLSKLRDVLINYSNEIKITGQDNQPVAELSKGWEVDSLSGSVKSEWQATGCPVSLARKDSSYKLKLIPGIPYHPVYYTRSDSKCQRGEWENKAECMFINVPFWFLDEKNVPDKNFFTVSIPEPPFLEDTPCPQVNDKGKNVHNLDRLEEILGFDKGHLQLKVVKAYRDSSEEEFKSCGYDNKMIIAFQTDGDKQRWSCTIESHELHCQREQVKLEEIQ